jgi:hypothetical protein
VRPCNNIILAATLALAGPWAAGQTVYRCGSSYSQQPCPGGTAVEVSDPRTPADAVRAGRVATADAKRADALEKARLAREKNAPQAIVIEPPAVAEPETASYRDGTRPKVGKLEQFTAVEPRQPGEGRKKHGKEKAKKKEKEEKAKDKPAPGLAS